eukprot:324541-Prymnesium_polylepis.1
MLFWTAAHAASGQVCGRCNARRAVTLRRSQVICRQDAEIACSSCRQVVSVHWLTLCFSDEGEERQYAARRFRQSYPVFVGFCLLFGGLKCVYACAFPETWALQAPDFFILATCLAIRVWAHGKSSQDVAIGVLCWGWCASCERSSFLAPHCFNNRASPSSIP